VLNSAHFGLSDEKSGIADSEQYRRSEMVRCRAARISLLN
jgi:hypothetical protein